MKATMKNVTITENNENLVTFAQTIDFTELFTHIEGFVKIDCDFQQPEITTSRNGDVYIEFTSADIKDQTGPFAFILRKCHIAQFSNGVIRDKETQEIRYWTTVSIRYEHHDGGSNGMNVCRAWYSNSKGWVFADVGDRR